MGYTGGNVKLKWVTHVTMLTNQLPLISRSVMHVTVELQSASPDEVLTMSLLVTVTNQKCV